MTNVHFGNSGYARKAGDNYQTIDPRCTQALAETLAAQGFELNGRIVDICGAQGSQIVDQLQKLGYDANAVSEAFVHHEADWIVTNPPYARAVVDKFIEHALAHVQSGSCFGAAFLMRDSWDFSSGRTAFFDSPLYAGQIKMRFRPWWTESRVAQPMHNYVWHIWSQGLFSGNENPSTLYWPKKALADTKFRFFKMNK